MQLGTPGSPHYSFYGVAEAVTDWLTCRILKPPHGKGISFLKMADALAFPLVLLLTAEGNGSKYLYRNQSYSLELQIYLFACKYGF